MVKMTALDAMEKKNPELWSEPARARAVDLVMIGHLLEGRLAREGVTNAAGLQRSGATTSCPSPLQTLRSGSPDSALRSTR